MLSIEMLPARQGDALWVEYGVPSRRLLVDGGPAETWKHLKARIEAQPLEERHFELLLISHIDIDHIGGARPLLEQAGDLGVTFGDIWFNGYRHLPETPIESLGPVQGEVLTTLLVGERYPWNEAFHRRAIVVPNGDDAPPSRELEGGLAVTVLSPGPAQLERLRPIWSAEVTKHGLNPKVEPEPPTPLPKGVEALGAAPDVAQLAATPFHPDTAAPNGTSVALLLELKDGPSAVVAADAFPSVLQQSVGRLLRERGQRRLRLEAFKLPHHGSRANTNRGLLELIDCPLHLFSTDGTQTRHPDREAVARVLDTATQNVSLGFNYLSDQNEVWRDPGTVERYGYGLRCPDPGEAGLAVTLRA
jgi:hypothetical protein